MDPISLLVYVLCFVLVVWLAVWIIQKTLPGDVQQIALIVVGVIALVVLLSAVSGFIGLPRLRR